MLVIHSLQQLFMESLRSAGAAMQLMSPTSVRTMPSGERLIKLHAFMQPAVRLFLRLL